LRKITSKSFDKTRNSFIVRIREGYENRGLGKTILEKYFLKGR
jgi:hypothetical protein